MVVVIVILIDWSILVYTNLYSIPITLFLAFGYYVNIRYMSCLSVEISIELKVRYITQQMCVLITYW